MHSLILRESDEKAGSFRFLDLEKPMIMDTPEAPDGRPDRKELSPYLPAQKNKHVPPPPIPASKPITSADVIKKLTDGSSPSGKGK